MDCVFCKIVSGEIPSKKAYEDDKVLAVFDLEPQAPVHILIVPKEHIESVDRVNSQNSQIIGYIFEIAAKLAKEFGLSKGYRIVANCGEDGGQTVGHLHFHLLGGRFMQWPPG